jgi:HEAT repeat protein
MTDILQNLRGGDLRSIGRANEVAQEIEKNSSLFEAVFSGLYDSDPIVRMRSADVIEKVTRHKPELLSSHTTEIISILTSDDQQEVCWHMAQIAPRLEYTANEENLIIKALKSYLSHKSKIVRVSAIESLAIFAERNSSILNEVIDVIKNQIETGSPAVQVRGRKLLQRLEGEQTNPKT